MPLFSPAKETLQPTRIDARRSRRCPRAGLPSALAWYQEKLDFRVTGRIEGAGLTWAFLAPANDDRFQIELGEQEVQRLSGDEDRLARE
jgi:hypothetical protein